MFNSIPEYLRRQAVSQLFAPNTFRKAWEIWQPTIKDLLGPTPTENEIINLGDYLSSIFRSTGNAGRAQGDLAGAGAAWESLICWYINICTIGSRIVAIRQMSLVPQPIQDAITVNYGNFCCNTESDITVIVFPADEMYEKDIVSHDPIFNGGITIKPLEKQNLNVGYLNYLVNRDFSDFEIGIVQCKTNWNDNAQIPMLWDMIYSAGGFRGRNITIGRNGFSIQAAKNFTYAFVTVPSKIKDTYLANHVKIKRVANLSGGNYWGLPTVEGVARSIKEIFTNNYNSGFRESLRTDIRGAIPFLEPGDFLSYFRIK